MFEIITNSHLLLWFDLTICLSLTAGGILVVFRVGQNRELPSVRYLQIFLILLSMFVYYSLWSNILLSRFSNIDNVERVSSIISQMGIPFYMVSLIMQLIWVCKIKEVSIAQCLGLMSFGVMVVLLCFILWGWPVADKLEAAYSVISLLTGLMVSILLIIGKDVVEQRKWAFLLAALSMGSGLLHVGYFIGLSQNSFFDVVFVFLFVLFNTTFAVLYLYTGLGELLVHSFEDFIDKHGISKRETDVLQGIYAGKTNQEIADSLFITLQTVKDHSSRIYQKTFVKNRGQLTTLLRESDVSNRAGRV